MSTTLAPERTSRLLSVAAARWVAFAGGVWALAFAALHAYWASGGRVGVPAATAPIAELPLFLAYDVVAGAVLFTAGVVGLVLAAPTGGGRARLFLVHLALVGATVALLRGGLGLLQDSTGWATGEPFTVTGALCDGWFTVAGAVFLVAARRLRPTARVVTGRRR